MDAIGKERPTVVLLGDSITHGMEPPCEEGQFSLLRHIKVSAMKFLGRGCLGMFDIRKELPQYNVVVMGFNGRRTDQLWNDTFPGSHGEDHVAEVLALHPTAVVLMAGTNDLREGVSPAIAAGNLAIIKQRLHAQVPIVLTANIPYIVDVTHQNVREFNADAGADIDYFSVLDSGDIQNTSLFDIDHVHPNQAGRRAMFLVLRPALILRLSGNTALSSHGRTAMEWLA